MLLLLKSDGQALSYSSGMNYYLILELLQPLEKQIQSQKLIENCIYKNHVENLYNEIPKDNIEDELIENLEEDFEENNNILSEVWTSFQREIVYTLNEQEKDLWSDLKNEFGH